jgi:hypothetical protein
MSTKAKALKVAERFGFMLDELNSGKCGIWFSVVLDHPTHSIGYDCRSITVEDAGTGLKAAGACAWEEAIERMEAEGPLLTPCADPECEYHHEIDEAPAEA